MKQPAPPIGISANRGLGQAQMSFVRSWAEGLDLVAAWNRYLYPHGAGDARRARCELQRLLDELRRLARAHGRADLSALLCRDPQAIPDKPGCALSLEAFAAQQPADFYSEAELIEIYQAQVDRVDSRSAARRRQRLRERLVAGVQWLAQVGVREPKPDDPAADWIDPRVAQRLSMSGIVTLQQLVCRIRSKGFHWHRGIPKLGPKGASRIVRWLQEQAPSLGPLPCPALMPPGQVDTAALTAAPCTGIVPLERFMTPPELDGSAGSNRAPAALCQVAAVNDHEAIQAWLLSRTPGTHTWRAYRKEAERWLLWAALERRKALSSLGGDDCVAYRNFLAAPGREWTGPRNAQRWSQAWRPFEGPLSNRSQAAALAIVRSLCSWLVRGRYLDRNPWMDVHGRAEAAVTPQLRAFSPAQWDLVQGWVAAQPPTPALSRLRFLLDFAYTTGMRLSELAAARVGWLRQDPIDDGARAWSVRMPGKRNPWREVPLADPAIAALKAYFAGRGLNMDLLANPPETPLVARLDRNAPLSAARLYEVLVAGFGQCAAALAVQDRHAAARIRDASTHWLCHTHRAHAAARGVPQDILQANLGRNSLAGTALDVRTARGRRHRAMQAAFAGLPGKACEAAQGPEASCPSGLEPGSPW